MKLSRKSFQFALAIAASALLHVAARPAGADIVVAENLLVDLRATDATAGTAAWSNLGTLGGSFAEVSDAQPGMFGPNNTPGVWFDGLADGDAYRGPASPAGITGNGTRSIEVWAYQLADGQPTGAGAAIESEETIVSWGRRGGGNGTNMAFNYGSDGGFGAVGHWGGGFDMGWSGTPAAGQWHHLVYTYDGAAARVYADGALKTTLNVALNTHPGFAINVAGQNSTSAATPGTLDAGLRFSGAIGQVRIHDGTLTAAAIANNFNAEAAAYGVTPPPPPPPPVGLVSLWRFNDGANLGRDSMPRANDLSPQGDAAYDWDGKEGGAVRLDGSGDMLDASSFPTEVPTGNESYTVAAWIKPEAMGARGIVAWGNYGTSRTVNALRLNGDNGFSHYWWAADMVPSDAQVAGLGVDLDAGDWHHVAATFDNLTGQRTMYLDGQVLATDFPGTNNAAPLNFAIGRSCTFCGGGEFFDGLIDDVAIFDEALDINGIRVAMSGDFRTLGGPIPEPSTFALAGIAAAMGAVAMLRRRRGRQD